MPLAYHIVGWPDVYEVNQKGRKYDPASSDKLRQKPLRYVRWRVAGRRPGEGYLGLERASRPQTAAGWLWSHSLGLSAAGRMMVAYATFGKLVEIAADNGSDRRGWIVDNSGIPMGPRDVAFCTRFPERYVKVGLTVLCDQRIAWLEVAPVPWDVASPGNGGRAPGQNIWIPGTARETLIYIPDTLNGRLDTRPEGQHEGSWGLEASKPTCGSEKIPLTTSGGTAEDPELADQARAFAKAVGDIFGVGKNGGGAFQAGRDLMVLAKAGEHVMSGDLGVNRQKAIEDCVLRAKDLVRCHKTGKVGNPIACWLAWFKGQLATRGKEW